MSLTVILAWIMKYKMFVVVGGLIIMVVLMFKLGGVNAGLDMAKRLLASKEIEAVEKLKAKLAATEELSKVNANKAKVIESKYVSKERELQQVRGQLQDVRRRLQDAEQRLASITIPVSIDDRVKRLRELGLKSATVTAKPK